MEMNEPKYPRVATVFEILAGIGFFVAISLGLVTAGDQVPIPWPELIGLVLGSLFLIGLAAIIRGLYRIEQATYSHTGDTEIAAHLKKIAELQESKEELEDKLRAAIQAFGNDDDNIVEPIKAPMQKVVAEIEAEIATHQKAIAKLVEAEVIAKLRGLSFQQTYPRRGQQKC